MDAAKGLECRLTELEDLFELDKLREKIKCARARNSYSVQHFVQHMGAGR